VNKRFFHVIQRALYNLYWMQRIKGHTICRLLIDNPVLFVPVGWALT
jgi:hypothetical protein